MVNRKLQAINKFFPMPNEIFGLELSAGEIAVYAYLLLLENRKSYQCYPSYKAIGKAVKMSTNTVRKYVSTLEAKQLITTEPTKVQAGDGHKRNGTLLYTLRPIKDAVDYYNAKELAQLEAYCRRVHTLEEYERTTPHKALCAENDKQAGQRHLSES